MEVRRTGRFRRAALALTAATAAILIAVWATPAFAETQARNIEICKKGPVTGNFKFKVNGGALRGGVDVTVPAGACSTPIPVPQFRNRVVEVKKVGIEVTDITTVPDGALLVKDLALRKAVVGVPSGQDVAVTFVNAPASSGLKVCKFSSTVALQGQSFSFTVNGGPAFSVTAGPPSAPNCGPVQQFPQGTKVTVQELAVVNVVVASITVSPPDGSTIDLNNRTATTTLGPGVTVVTYQDEPSPTPQTGFLEICKDASGPFVSGSFSFTTTAPGFSRIDVVRVGQCTGPITVPAGTLTVTEAPRSGFQLVGVFTQPPDRLISANLSNQTATVTVPVSSNPQTETTVHFVNARQLGEIKVCKVLDSHSAALEGKTFTFTFTSPSLGTGTISIIAGPVGTQACVIRGGFPVGEPVTISENATANVKLIDVTISPPEGGTVSNGVATVTPSIAGPITVTFTNQAQGTLEVCKSSGFAITGVPFNFLVNGTIPVTVKAGQCSGAITVPAGTATVQELLAPDSNFEFAFIFTFPSGRLISFDPATLTATVAVPFGGPENETIVQFSNRVKLGTFKICKTSPEPTLQTVTFHFDWKSDNGATGSADLKPGECSQFFADFVLKADGTPNNVTVVEAPSPDTHVDSIVLTGAGIEVLNSPATGTEIFTLRPGNTIVTYNNVRNPPPPPAGRSTG